MDKTYAMIAEAKWVLDTGATYHMTSDGTQFQGVTPVQTSISITNGATIKAAGEGNVTLNLEVNSTKNQVILKKVLYMRKMGSSGLVLVRCIQAARGVVCFAEKTVSITHQ